MMIILVVMTMMMVVTMVTMVRREIFLSTCTESASQLSSKVSPSMVNLKCT